jgi:hypothetical protein
VAGDGAEPGRAAIEQAFAAVYPDGPAEHRALPPAERPPAPGGVLAGISAYRADDRWHLVTFGLTDLAAKTENERPQTSHFGHELTLMVPPAERPPDWAFDLLLGVAKVCVTHGRPFHAGARMAPGAPVDGARSKIVAVGLRLDPLVVPSAFPFGRYVLLQAVGVQEVEYRLMRRAGTLKVLEQLALRDPLLRTDPARGGAAP